jgi:hypothetical protein
MDRPSELHDVRDRRAALLTEDRFAYCLRSPRQPVTTRVLIDRLRDRRARVSEHLGNVEHVDPGIQADRSERSSATVRDTVCSSSMAGIRSSRGGRLAPSASFARTSAASATRSACSTPTTTGSSSRGSGPACSARRFGAGSRATSTRGRSGRYGTRAGCRSGRCTASRC